MCGIAGFVNLDGAPADARLLDTMIREIGHRGPDDRGIRVARSTGLAHARLSIIDVAGGHQPAHEGDGRRRLRSWHRRVGPGDHDAAHDTPSEEAASSLSAASMRSSTTGQVYSRRT